MRYLALVIIGFALLFMMGCTPKQGTLAKGATAKYIIVLPDAPTQVETTAAHELKCYLDTIAEAEFSIVSESKADASQPMLIVGNSAIARKLLPNVDPAKLSYDGIVIETVGKDIVMLGHPVRGTLYAVNTFLEEALGVRWWTSTESYVPRTKRLKVADLHINYAPKLIYRESFYKDAIASSDFFKDSRANADKIPFAARMKCNGDFSKITPEYGGYYKFLPYVHSFNTFIPRDKYFATHPEWFSLIDGKRSNHHFSQLCLSNEAMRKEFIKNVLDFLHANPDVRFISISQNDTDPKNWGCQCADCRAIVEEEGSEAGPIIRLVNEVAEAVEKDFPDVWVETLAYRYSRKAPLKVKPRHNVVVRLCTIECSFSQPLAEGEQNKPIRDDIEAWSKIADHLFVWNYVTSFSNYLLPHPNIHTLASDIRFFVKNHTIGLFEQGDAYCDAGDFVRMRNWVVSKLMWNPDLDENQLIDEFLTGYYGTDAAPYLRQYWDVLTKAVKDSSYYLTCYQSNTAGWLTVPAYAQAASLLQQALDATKDETLRSRLRREEIPIKYVMLLEIERFKTYAKEHGNSPVVLPSDPEKALNEFMALLNEFNVTMVHEDWTPKANHLSWVERDLRKKLGLEMVRSAL